MLRHYFMDILRCIFLCQTSCHQRHRNNHTIIMAEHYLGQHFVKVMELGGTETLPDGFIAANTLAGTNNMQIFVCGNEDQIMLMSRFDNLGKGASGAFGLFFAFLLFQPRCFVYPQHYIHILYCCTACTFSKVIKSRHKQKTNQKHRTKNRRCRAALALPRDGGEQPQRGQNKAKSKIKPNRGQSPHHKSTV